MGPVKGLILGPVKGVLVGPVKGLLVGPVKGLLFSRNLLAAFLLAKVQGKMLQQRQGRDDCK